MSEVLFADGVRQDFDRIVEHLLEHEGSEPAGRIEAILTAVDALSLNPLIGRPAHDPFRELVIGQERSGYVALYRYSQALDQVVIVALRAQKEVGYRHP